MSTPNHPDILASLDEIAPPAGPQNQGYSHDDILAILAQLDETKLSPALVDRVRDQLERESVARRIHETRAEVVNLLVQEIFDKDALYQQCRRHNARHAGLTAIFRAVGLPTGALDPSHPFRKALTKAFSAAARARPPPSPPQY
ncbi:hypothetical protein BDB00DRAFT_790745 [Zychaea mexicana]|uniref:uncharacterized protein n=1 Tax=Zychaea mexicana TaxID=64656 RepID=UPI0022FDBA4C|nr:uncharacterized protein BDB00DRAFT_790745 [Zychaea mexicana]KAI9489926.1 hypothetical protein BDB00DRAFT_790745 [Zychaea mexicana]